MRLLLDTHVLIGLLEGRLESFRPVVREALTGSSSALYASVASLWEIAIKVRLEKLYLEPALMELPELFESLGMTLLPIEAAHVLVEAEPAPATRDPFDRLLLSQCLVENLRLVTFDRLLVGHPLAWRIA